MVTLVCVLVQYYMDPILYSITWTVQCNTVQCYMDPILY